MTVYIRSKLFLVKKPGNNRNGRILILDASLDNDKYMLINLYNASNKQEQVSTLTNLQCMLKELNINDSKQIVFAGGFSFFDVVLEVTGEKPRKSNTVSKRLEIKIFHDLHDIWKIRNPTKKSYTSRQKYFSGFEQHRLVYIFTSNSFQEFTKKAGILTALSTAVSCFFLPSM